MNIELHEQLDKLTEKYNVVLIDGPWGYGKTYQINNYLNKNKKVKYVSLFGMENVEELSEEIYKCVHPNLYKSNKILKLYLSI